MKKVFVWVSLGVLLLGLLMFAEYRLIMKNIIPYQDGDGIICVEVFGQVDEYYID